MHTTGLAVLLSSVVTVFAAELPEGVRRVKVLNYADCFALSNAETRVTLCHQVGGRVLEYSFKGINALYLDPEEAKWGTPGGSRAPDSAGRFDIGPEYLIPRRDKLWSGAWLAEAIGPRAVRLTSQADESTGVRNDRSRYFIVPQQFSCSFLRFVIGDAETFAGFLKLSVDSSNKNFVPNSNIVLGGDANSPSRTVTVTPLPDQIGKTTITITVADGDGLTASTTFSVAVMEDQRPPNRPINDSPPNGAGNVLLLVALKANAFSDPDPGDVQAASQWVIQRGSDGLEVFNREVISGDLTSVFVIPALDYSTSYTWRVRYKDNHGNWSDYSTPTSFRTQSPLNTPPSISEIGSKQSLVNAPLKGVVFSVADSETPLDALVVKAQSDNQALVPDRNIIVEGTGRDRALSITSATDQIGSARITITVTDAGALSATHTFELTITRPDKPIAVGPANDDFANRIKLTGSPLSIEGANTNATKEAGEPNHVGKPATKSVWWSWTASQSGNVTISTKGSAIDTFLAVYAGTSLANLVPVASNDDDPDGGSTSRVSFRAQSGTEYQIAVDAFGGEVGAIKLNITSEVAKPPLHIEVSGKNIILSWPASATGFVIEMSESLETPSWTRNSLTPAVVGDRYSAKIPITVGTRFYRLRGP